jgi:ATP-dependent exoDNAse (exonuclease V) alpha subunit
MERRRGSREAQGRQLAREVEFALPRELNQADAVALARDLVQREFVSVGMVADLNIHWDLGADSEAKLHAHVMLATRQAGPGGFGPKVRDWNRTDLLEYWREVWAEHVNARLAELDVDARIDHRPLADQQIWLEPHNKIRAAGARRQDRAEEAEQAAEHRDIAWLSGERIIADPVVTLDAITRLQSAFTRHDLLRFVHRHSDDKDQFDRAVSAVMMSPDLVALGRDGRERLTSREMLAVELALERSADALAERRGHGVS